MTEHSSVPRLDLAPKLRRPLSLWKPLDYLRLLYWVFFFPQALQWYVDTFGNGNQLIVEREKNWHRREGWEWLFYHPVELRFILQALVLILVTPFLVGVIFQKMGVPLNWSFVIIGVVIGVFRFVFNKVGIIHGMHYFSNSESAKVSWLAPFIGFSIMSSLGSSVALALVVNDIDYLKTNILTNVKNIISIIKVGVVFGIAFGLTQGWVKSLKLEGRKNKVYKSNWVWKIVSFLLRRVVYISLFLLVIGGSFGQETLGLIACTFLIAFVVKEIFSQRLEDWLFAILSTKLISGNRRWQIPHVTPISLPYLSSQLTNWLLRDWEIGLHNLNQVRNYSLQFIPVTQALSRALTETPPEQVIFRVAQLTSNQLEELRYIWEPAIKSYRHIKFDTPVHAVWYSFWELHKIDYYYASEYKDRGCLQGASRAFFVVRSLPYGEEMFTLTQTLEAFLDAEELATIAMQQMPVVPKESLLCLATWEALACLDRVIKDARIVQRSRYVAAKSIALNRALEELKNLPNKTHDLPPAEQAILTIIRLIASNWARSLQGVANKLEEISITKPVRNPYVVGNPVEGNHFVGREDVIRQLEEFWVMGHQLQSVVLYGHRRMGKTSILLNVDNRLGSGVHVAYINLLVLGDSPQGVGEVLMAISDVISEAVNLPPPADADLLNLPYRTFERYLKQVVETLHLKSLHGLIIALDEFEKIEELIEIGKIPQDFLGFLRGLVQMSSKVAFAFAGLHTLEEMTADYFQPFFASVIPIHIGFMERTATGQILTNPTISSPSFGEIEGDEDFPLDYTAEAVNKIYDLTHGQPYLIQLVGFQLVRRFNEQFFEMERYREPVFTVEDVEAIINDSEFFKRGRYYFDGVWGQAVRGAVGQHDILRILAPHPQGLTLNALLQSTDMDEATLQEALKTLTRHDVVKEIDGCWRIIVELFRLWLLQT
ncbi:helix-turn-helix domain-containing protein [Hassallia byssoidea VB512170]|uniref:Helix-turn-helix domain-containing protein n=1 Tax=Hassallia byssoidea VB512170 TaxID=1304833 RepID=A0A846HGE0_9CYAN|nr:ATP-binding protein [Hassalia byssoidea]NEU75889.1 helix-turn-helix domain-containing protein [Hassalia byssoidea VB512170]